MEKDLARYAAHLRDLPFVREVRILPPPLPAKGPRPDALLVLTAPEGDHELLVETKRTHLTYALADHVVAQRTTLDGPPRPWILLAPYVPRKMGQHLAAQGVNYIDLEGNCHLRLGDRHIAAIEGRIPLRKEPEGRGLRAAGQNVQFAILANPELLDEGIVHIAERAGVGKTTVADTLAKMEHEGFLAVVGGRRRLVNPKALLDRWLAGYAHVVRPRMLLGRYRTQDADPEQLERRVEETLGEELAWAWGGGAAAMRLTQHYRGETTALHLALPMPDLPKRLRALRDPQGPLLLLTVPGPVAFEGALPRTVHPLLVYTELLTSGDERAREAAAELHARYLGEMA